MPRYIDLDKALADILDEKCRSEKEDSIRALEWFERLLQRQPIADVVPRSEYKELERQFKELDAECDRLEKAEANFYNAVIKAKQEVAREIFEEIENLKHTKFDWNDYVEWEAIDELKKKYIGE